MSSVHYNLDYLQQVFQGNDAMVRRILDLFEEQVPGYLTEMEDRWRQGEWRKLHPMAHKARSSISMLGMTSLLEDIVHIEHTSRSGSTLVTSGSGLCPLARPWISVSRRFDETEVPRRAEATDRLTPGRNVLDVDKPHPDSGVLERFGSRGPFAKRGVVPLEREPCLFRDFPSRRC